MRIHPSLPSIFPARLRPAVPHVRRQLHWRALHHVALPVSFHGRHVLWRQPIRRRQATPPDLFVGLCAFCLGSVLDGARCFVIKGTCLCHCLRHGLRAGDKISFEDGGGQFPQFCRVDSTTEWPAPRPVAEEHLDRCLPLPPVCRTAPWRSPCDTTTSDLRLFHAGVSKSILENVTKVFNQIAA